MSSSHPVARQPPYLTAEVEREGAGGVLVPCAQYTAQYCAVATWGRFN